MLIVQGLALYQLFSPFYLWPPKISLPEDLIEPDEPLEYEINLDPGPMGPTPAPKPEENSPRPSESAQVAQMQSAPSSNSAGVDTQQQPNQVEPNQVEPSPAQMAAAVLSVSRSTPAPQPLLAVEATPAPSAPDMVLVPSVDVAAQSTTEEPAEERGAASGAPANSDATSTPVRPLALEVNAAPDRIAAAPISILPGVQAPVLEPVIVASPVATAARAIDRVPVDLTIASEQVVLSEITAPAPAVDIAQPVRVKPELPKPDLRVEQAKPSVPKPMLPVAAARPVLSRTDAASTNPSKATTPDLRVDASVPNVAKPGVPAAARPVLTTNSAAKPSASESVQLEVARGEIVRPTMVVQGPIAANDPQSTPADRATAAPTPGVSSNAPNTASKPGQSDAANGLPLDPFARAGSGKGPRDLIGQGLDAAAAQVGENGTDSNERGNAFRRYNDPFADDAPNPLAGLRQREPQLFSDVSRFLVKTFGPAALGFAVGASSEIDDFSGPNAGILIDQWIQQHHSDLQRECRLRQETMDEHIRGLLCGDL